MTGHVPTQVIIDGLAIIGAVTVLAGVAGAGVAGAIEVGMVVRRRRARRWARRDVRTLERSQR